MGVSRRLINQEELFHTLSSESVIINNFDISSQEDKEKLNNLILTRYDGDSLDVLPSCDCGNITGEYNVGVRCKECNTLCVSVTERPLESALWITTPQSIDKLINPDAWIILANRFTFSGHNLIEWLCNPYYKTPTDPVPAKINQLKKLNPPRGLNNFYRHFEAIMELLIENKLIQNSKQDKELFIDFIRTFKDCIFTKYVPIPSKLAFITEDTPTGRYVDLSMTPAIDAIRTISSLENEPITPSLKKKEAACVKTIVKLAKYYNDFGSKQLGSKFGWFRKHIYGSRLHFSFRSVISSLSENHDYDEVHMPWSMSTMVLEAQLINKLLKRGFTPNDALGFLREHTLQYHPLLEELFNELIIEGPDNKIPILFQRNPSLVRGSAQQLNITKVKNDPGDNTVSLSVLVLSALNADH